LTFYPRKSTDLNERFRSPAAAIPAIGDQLGFVNAGDLDLVVIENLTTPNAKSNTVFPVCGEGICP